MQIYPAPLRTNPDRIAKAKREFQTKGVLDHGVVRPPIAHSWIRCRQKGLNPDEIDTSFLVSEEEHHAVVRRNSALLTAAAPFLENLLITLRRSRYILVLYSEEGYHLLIRGSAADFSIIDEYDLELIRKMCCREECVGTCGFSLTSELKAPVQIIGPEHYLNLIPNFSGSYAPIFGPDNDIRGVLGITSLTDAQPHLHTLGMAMASAVAISTLLRNEEVQEALDRSAKFLEATVNSLSDGLISVDKAGNILQINRPARRLLGPYLPVQNLEELDSRAAASPSFDEMLTKAVNAGSECKEDHLQTLSANGTSRHCITSCMPIRTSEGRCCGAVFLVRSVDRMKKALGNFSSHQACYRFHDIIGESPAIREARGLGARAAQTRSNVLIEGESGTGKELFAHSIHCASDRVDQPFVTVNCSAIPSELFESILFGYEKGAFTGARSEGAIGKFELANGGTLLLDEIGDLPINLQIKLLRVLAEERVERIGGNRLIPIDVTLIATTNKRLSEEVKAGRFRLDLYYRLNILKILIPPLRERKQDIEPLAAHFIHRLAPRMGKRCEGITPAFLTALQEHDWPGNVRELRNVVERALILSKRPVLDLSSLPKDLEDSGGKKTSLSCDPLSEDELDLATLERLSIQRALIRANGNKSKAARMLNIGRETLYRKIRNLAIEVP